MESKRHRMYKLTLGALRVKTFKQPLSGEEEAYYIRAMHRADAEEARKARLILIERNLRLVAHIAKKYQNCEEDPEDLISIGTIGLIKAIDTFNGEKGSRLATYAVRCIENELLMMLRNKKKISREVSLYEPIGTDKEGNEINLLDIIVQEQPDVVEQMEQKKNLGKLSGLIDSLLTEREKEIICLRYGIMGVKEKTQREIGDRLQISRSYVSRIEKRALFKLREGLMQE